VCNEALLQRLEAIGVHVQQPVQLRLNNPYLQQAYDLALLCVYWFGFVGFGTWNLVDFA
jgi:hypothetical protein